MISPIQEKPFNIMIMNKRSQRVPSKKKRNMVFIFLGLSKVRKSQK